MYNRKLARRLGLATYCTASLTEPVTVHGTYKCTRGHAHYASWLNHRPTVSPIGYDWAFLAALSAADDAAIAVADAGSRAYAAEHNRILEERGYGAVVLKTRP